MSFLGRLKHRFYRIPAEKIARIRQWGIAATLQHPRHRREMEAFVWEELSVPERSHSDTTFEVSFMTGAHHWYQTALCSWSLQRQISSGLAVEILDDGTLTREQGNRLMELNQQCRIISKAEADSRVEQFLPHRRYERLHQWRERQMLFRKLVDTHVGHSEWRLFLDSDMLFFQPPTELVAWWKSPDCCIFQTDCWESYGYSRELIQSLIGQQMIAAANIGIFSLKGADIDWDEVQHWLQKLEDAEGSRYNVTQCVTTMLMSRQPHKRLDAGAYLVFPGPGRPPPDSSRILEHYVADAKPWYFGHAWRNLVQPAR